MSDKRQSSVDWLNQQLVDRQNGNGDSRSWDEILKHAKAMHENNMKSFAIKAVSMAVNEDIDNPYNLDELYNETFGGQDNE